MLKRLLASVTLVLFAAAAVLAQNTNSNTTQTPATGDRRTSPAKKPTNAPAETQSGSTQTPAPTPRPATRRRPAQTPAEATTERGVRDAFDTLIDGIRRADADAVMGVYWNSPRLILFNNNGTVTKSWEQVRSNRESLYARVKDVKLDVRDVEVRLLGTNAAVVTCLWEQSQQADGQPERATGRLTLVFQKIGNAWKAVHAHTSPDRPDPSRLLPSERATDSDTTAKPQAKP